MICVIHALASLLLRASKLSFTGTFTSDTDLLSFAFTLLHSTTGVTFRGWSYAGGTNAASQSIVSGGFELF